MRLSRRAALLLAALTAAVPALAVPALTQPAGADEGDYYTSPNDPPGANDWSCKPTAAHPRPVVLVHGTFGDREHLWEAISSRLSQAGYCVFSLDYGNRATGRIQDSAHQLARFTQRVLDATGAARVSMVGHSQGGMMPRYYLKFLGGAAEVNALVGIAPSNHGTNLSGLTNLLPFFPGAEDLISSLTPALTDQIVGSAFLTKLNAGGDTVPGVRYVTVGSRVDEMIQPFSNIALRGAGAENLVLQDLCADNLTGHFHLVYDPFVQQLLQRVLDPVRAPAPVCAPVPLGTGIPEVIIAGNS